jgi:hypothetical protein
MDRTGKNCNTPDFQMVGCSIRYSQEVALAKFKFAASCEDANCLSESRKNTVDKPYKTSRWNERLL